MNASAPTMRDHPPARRLAWLAPSACSDTTLPPSGPISEWLVDLSVAHDERHSRQRRNIAGRIAVNRDDVGLIAGSEPSNRLLQTERFRGQRRRRDDGIDR